MAGALLPSGCGDLLSLHPLYTAQDWVFDSAWLRERIHHEEALVARGNTPAVLIAPTANW